MIPSYYDAPTHEGSLSMRGDDQQTGYLFSYLSPDDRVPPDHPLRQIRQMTDAVSQRSDRKTVQTRGLDGRETCWTYLSKYRLEPILFPFEPLVLFATEAEGFS